VPKPPTNGTGKETHPSEPPATTADPPREPRRTLHIDFALSDDPQADSARLDEVLTLLAAHEGEDRFTITLRDANDAVRIVFRERTTRYCKELVSGLYALLGQDCLTVDRE
jgi:hypothetical protein